MTGYIGTERGSDWLYWDIEGRLLVILEQRGEMNGYTARETLWFYWDIIFYCH